MSQITRTYKLRRFSDSSDPDYASALAVYVTHIGPDSRTNSNEITYWIDRSYREFGDEFCVLGFFVDRQVVGFAEVALLRGSRVLFFDYLVLHRAHRSRGEYFQFAQLLQEWIDQQRLEFDFTVAEVSFDSGGMIPSEHSALLVELFKQMGFAAADCEYWSPPLGLANPQSDMRAHLLVGAREKISAVKREALVQIVRSVYFDHYGRWYRPFHQGADSERYDELLTRRFDAFVRGLGSVDSVVLDGVKMLDPPMLPSGVPRASRPPVVLPLVVVLVIAILSAGFFLLQSYLRLPTQTVVIVVAASVVVVVTGFALFDRSARAILRQLLAALSRIFGRPE